MNQMSIGLDRCRRKLMTAVAAVVLVAVWAPPSGRAFVLSLAGPLGDDGAVIDEATVLYARSGRGIVHRLAEVGPPRGGLPELRDLGFPFVADDGSVIFAAMVAEDHRPRWTVFRADMQSTPLKISKIQLPNSNDSFAAPILRADPWPAIDARGDLIFCAQDTDGKEAIFVLSDGELSHLVRSGERTQEGHRLIHLAFGSIRTLGPDGVAFVGWLENHLRSSTLPGASARLPALPARRLAVSILQGQS